MQARFKRQESIPVLVQPPQHLRSPQYCKIVLDIFLQRKLLCSDVILQRRNIDRLGKEKQKYFIKNNDAYYETTIECFGIPRFK